MPSLVYGICKERGYLKDVVNPFTEIEYKKPKRTHMTDWNKKELTDSQIGLLNNGCIELRKYPGQPQLFQLESLTGREVKT